MTGFTRESLSTGWDGRRPASCCRVSIANRSRYSNMGMDAPWREEMSAESPTEKGILMSRSVISMPGFSHLD